MKARITIISFLFVVCTLVAQKPNIVFIVADDLGYGDLGCYGQDKIETPNIDKLAASGMKFTDHYAGSTVCAPSRASLFSGLHTGHCAVRDNYEVNPEGQSEITDGSLVLMQKFKEAGYTTGVFGKWGMGYPGSQSSPENIGVDVFYGYNCQRYAHKYYPTHLWDNTTKVVLDGNMDSIPKTYAPDLIQEKTLQFIGDNKNEKFFLFVPFVLPHVEMKVPDDEILQKYKAKGWPIKSWTNVRGDYPYEPNYYGKYCSVDDIYATYAAMVGRIDKYVGEILDKIEAEGLSENTLVVFCSDNGGAKEGGSQYSTPFFKSNGELKGFKRDLYEGGIRVPFIASWKGQIQPNTVNGAITAYWDILPTFADLATFDIHKKIDGESFASELFGIPSERSNVVYHEFHASPKQSVRWNNWKAIWLNVNGTEKAYLYDLDTDIKESVNLAEKRPKIMVKMDYVRKQEHIYNTRSNFRKGLVEPDTFYFSIDSNQIDYTTLPDVAYSDRRVNWEIQTTGNANASINQVGELITSGNGEVIITGTTVNGLTANQSIVLGDVETIVDTTFVTVYDTVLVFDTTFVMHYDTLLTQIYDTVMIYDTVTTEPPVIVEPPVIEPKEPKGVLFSLDNFSGAVITEPIKLDKVEITCKVNPIPHKRIGKNYALIHPENENLSNPSLETVLFLKFISAGKFKLGTYLNGKEQLSTNEASCGEISDIKVVIDNGIIILGLNGVVTNVEIAPIAQTLPMNIGKHQRWGGQTYNGEMTDFKITSKD